MTKKMHTMYVAKIEQSDSIFAIIIDFLVTASVIIAAFIVPAIMMKG